MTNLSKREISLYKRSEIEGETLAALLTEGATRAPIMADAVMSVASKGR
jgi:hypothetical protein